MVVQQENQLRAPGESQGASVTSRGARTPACRVETPLDASSKTHHQPPQTFFLSSPQSLPVFPNTLALASSPIMCPEGRFKPGQATSSMMNPRLALPGPPGRRRGERIGSLEKEIWTVSPAPETGVWENRFLGTFPSGAGPVT